jgi:hypothetical protein
MPSFSSLFHHKKSSHEDDKTGAQKAAESKAEAPASSQQPAPPASTEAEQPAPRAPLNPHAPPNIAPQFAPGTGPRAHGQMVQAEHLGVMAGGAVGWATGDGVGMGMVEGQVGANMIMQRVQQGQKQLYYRDQALNYRAGLPADGVGPSGGLAPPASTGRDRSRSRSQRREERRRARWERRAKRRDGGGAAGEHEASSGSESG